MPIAFNFKICDNSPLCNGIGACPLKLIKWNAEKRSLEVDNEKCIGCGACMKSCPVAGAICVAKDAAGLSSCRKVIEDDPRSRAELLKDRYGTDPTDPGLIVSQANFDEEVLKSDRVVIVDFWDEQHAKCKAYSIPYDELAPDRVVAPELIRKAGELRFKFRKAYVKENAELDEKLGIKVVPSLVLFYKGREIGRIEGAVKIDEKEKVVLAMRKALQQLR
jgi:thiol-disulfide isomerase/thioredoxin/NAD-dependent dihydropyrimidine dehydrogenase PreA subunit